MIASVSRHMRPKLFTVCSCDRERHIICTGRIEAKLHEKYWSLPRIRTFVLLVLSLLSPVQIATYDASVLMT